MTKTPSLLAVVLLTGCAPTRDIFEVDVTGADAVSAELQLCGSQMPLARDGFVYRIVHPITCEGDGYINVLLGDGRFIRCPIGYVTTQSRAAHWRFAINNGACISRP